MLKCMLPPGPEQIGLYGITARNTDRLRSKAGRYTTPVRLKMHLDILQAVL